MLHYGPSPTGKDDIQRTGAGLEFSSPESQSGDLLELFQKVSARLGLKESQSWS